jgi:hypothetical protein
VNIQSKVERFLSSASFLTFNFSSNAALLSFFFEDGGLDNFRNESNYVFLMDYFNGRNSKIVFTVTKDIVRVSIVDIDNGDTINISNPHFVVGNIERILNKEVPTETQFKLIILAKDEYAEMLVPETYATTDPIVIHGYSVINKA